MAISENLNGSWKHDIKTSVYNPGPTAERHLRVYESIGEGFKVTCEEIVAGREVSWSYTAEKYDGEIYPVHGRSDVDGIKSYLLNDTSTFGIFTLNGEEVGFYKRTLSSDGSILTVVESGRGDDSAPPYWNVSSFTRL